MVYLVIKRAMPTKKKQPETTPDDIFIESLRFLGKKSQAALTAVHTFIMTAKDIADNTNAEQAQSELADFYRQTQDALESGRSANPTIKNFAVTARDYQIDEECIEMFFLSLRMETTHGSFSRSEYKKYIAGIGEATGLMVLKVLCHKRDVLYHKLTSNARALGSAICKVLLLQHHGETYRRHERMHFPDVNKTTFNQARMAQVIASAEVNFQTARVGLMALPPGTRGAVAIVYAYHYELLRQMRHLTPAQLDAGKATVSNLRRTWLVAYGYLMPSQVLQRGSL